MALSASDFRTTHSDSGKQLLTADETETDALSLYCMRKHSRRFMPGSYYDLELKGKQPRRLLASMSGDGRLLAALPQPRTQQQATE